MPTRPNLLKSPTKWPKALFPLLTGAWCILNASGCGHATDTSQPTAVPVVATSVAGGTLVVPANMPPEQKAQILAQEKADLERNRQDAAAHAPK